MRVAAIALAAFLVGCGADEGAAPAVLPSGAGLVIPPGFPDPPIPDDNPLTPEKAELGRYLFYDARLSANGTQSCGSCHRQDIAFTDGLERSVGSTGEEHPRNSPTLTNVAYNATLTWAHPTLTSLEQQAMIPLFGELPIELGAVNHDEEILDRLRTDALYPALFAAAFPEDEDPIHFDNVTRATSSFLRTMISGGSPFDQFTYRGDKGALSAAAVRGMSLFYSERLECHHCHGGFNFTLSTIHAGSSPGDASAFHNTGLYNLDGEGAYPAGNTGVYGITGDLSDMGRFRAPTLRNVAVTAPYMHDGSMKTLDEVVRFYEAGGRVIESGPYAGDGRASPLKSALVPGFTLTDAERADLIAFIESLTDEDFLADPRFADPFPQP